MYDDTLAFMGTRNISGDTTGDFQHAISDLQTIRLRPELRLTEVPTPGHMALYLIAMFAKVLGAPVASDTELPSGRFVALHDPSFSEPWEGSWRIVTFARAVMEAETATDPMLGEVGWNWLTDSLTEVGAQFRVTVGTVTRVISEGYSALSDNISTVALEVRASWTPSGLDLGTYLSAWINLLCTIADLPPLPEGWWPCRVSVDE